MSEPNNNNGVPIFIGEPGYPACEHCHGHGIAMDWDGSFIVDSIEDEYVRCAACHGTGSPALVDDDW